MTSNPNVSYLLPEIGSWLRSAHSFSQNELDAISAAEITGRPLLIQGEPGLGKSQIARAIAADKKWPLITHTVNARTDIEDLLYRVDHVRRLSEAHLLAASGKTLDKSLANFLDPGPIWRALEFSVGKKNVYTEDCYPNPNHKNEAGWYIPQKPGCVLLIDEIDKAPPDVPNALLEVLSEMKFLVTQTGVTVAGNKKHLRIIITANEERELPSAFVRRCAALELGLGNDPKGRLCEIAYAHIENKLLPALDPDILEYAATCVVRERERLNEGNYRPGTSEFLDLLKVAAEHAQPGKDSDAAIRMMDRMGKYLIRKSVGSAENG